MKETHRNLADFQEYIDTDGDLRSAFETYVDLYHNDPFCISTKAAREKFLKYLDRALVAGRESTLEEDEAS